MLDHQLLIPWPQILDANVLKGTNLDLANNNGNNAGELGAKNGANGIEFIAEVV